MKKSIKLLMIIGSFIIFSISILNKFLYADEYIETIANKRNWESIIITEYNNLTDSKISSESKLKIEKIDYNKLKYSYEEYSDKPINKFGTLDSISNNTWVGYINDNLYGIMYCKIIIDNEHIKINIERLNKNCTTIEMFRNSKNKVYESFNYNLKDKTKDFISNNKKLKTKIKEIEFL